MRTAIDTNVISDLLGGGLAGSAAASVLRQLQLQGPLLICGVVYAELYARPATPPAAIDAFLKATDILLDWASSAAMWAEAGRANAAYHARRRAGGRHDVKPVLPDSLIGAHALHFADRLLTRNTGDFSDFPVLNLVTF